MYSDSEPLFVEGDVFRTTIPLSEAATATVGPCVACSGGQNKSADENDSDSVNDSVNDSVKLSATDAKVLAEIKRSPHATRSALASSIGVAISTIDRSVKRLKDVGLIERIGSDKAGCWKVLH